MTKSTYLILPLRDIVIFPHMIAPLFVGRIKSINAIEAVMEENKEIVLLTQKKTFYRRSKRKRFIQSWYLRQYSSDAKTS